MKALAIALAFFSLTNAIFGQGAIYLDNSQSPNGLALNAPSNYYSGTFGLEVWELNGTNVPANMNAASPFAAYTNLVADGFTLETVLSNQVTASPGVFQLGQVTLPDVNPPGSTVTLALVAWTGAAPDYSNAVAQNASLGVVAFTNPTAATNAPPPYLSDWSNQDLVMLSFTNYTLVLKPGWNLIANQLDNPNGNFLSNILLSNVSPALPDGSQVFKFINNSTSTFPWAVASYNQMLFTWIPNNVNLNPGEGAFVFNPSPSPVSNTFSGLRLLPRSTPYPFTFNNLFYLLSDQACEPSTYNLIVGAPPTLGSEVVQWTGTTNGQFIPYYMEHFYAKNKSTGATNWAGPPPALAIGESAWVSPSQFQYSSGPPPAPSTVSVVATNGFATVSWNVVPLPFGASYWFPESHFFLESSPDFITWTILSNAASPWSIDLSTNAAPQLFFRVIQQPYGP